jgi:hypothetical protein
MPKGFFSQGVCLLTDGRTTIAEIKRALVEHEFQVAKEVPANENLCFSGPSLLVPFLPEVNGYASIDVVEQAWPDTMGNPASDHLTFGAWSMGFFGPFAYPGGLTRALQHAWAWPQGRSLASTHGGFVRLRTSYVFGLGDAAPVLPKDYDSIRELNFLSRLSLAILAVPSVICYFNPNGEVLRDRPGFSQIWNACAEQKKLPLPLWVNVRFFGLNQNLGLMDTVGNGQMDIGDVEAIFPNAKYAPREVDYYLRNVTHFLLETHRRIHSGDAFDGPGESNLSWMVELKENGLIQPPRRVLRLYPKGNRREIEAAIAAAASPSR